MILLAQLTILQTVLAAVVAKPVAALARLEVFLLELEAWKEVEDL